MKILDVIETLFPNGYLDAATFASAQASAGGVRKIVRSIGKLPYLCTDLFVITATLLQKSGAYHVAPENERYFTLRALVVTGSMRKEWRDLGKEWRGDDLDMGPPPPHKLFALWTDLWAARNESVYVALQPSDSAPKWWTAALGLMCIADEAAEGLGFEPVPGRKGSFQSRIIDPKSDTRLRYSFSTADSDVACVLPKSRSPALGCTLRSLSHHLALLPPRGLARGYWLPNNSNHRSSDGKSKALNCLLVPLPYRVSATSFQGTRAGNERWGWFHLDPRWCSAELPGDGRSFEVFFKFLQALMAAAKEDVGEIHAIVFPEAALSSVVFRELVKRLEGSGVELLVSGLFDLGKADGSDLRPGNYAAMAAIGPASLLSYREKHHRWRLDRSQIQTYSLGSALDPSFGWWEDLNILSRSLDFYTLRGTSTVTTLICEDLARSDPCQELVRGIGPNLVFALLMDGPQLKARWPGRYATVLAEDPGSSVLCLTSFGLIERSNASGQLPPCRSIGLWRDDSGDTKELVLPLGSHALCLALYSHEFHGHTLDGRSDDGTSISWRMVGVQPVTAPSDTPGLKELMMGSWPAAAD